MMPMRSHAVRGAVRNAFAWTFAAALVAWAAVASAQDINKSATPGTPTQSNSGEAQGPEATRLGRYLVGDPAPDFTVKDMHDRESVTLSRLRGKPVVLIFGSCT